MTFILERYSEAEGWETVRTFKTLRGATTAGCVILKSYGYLRADRYEGEGFGRRHIVAEWKDKHVVVMRVWA